MKRPVIRNSVSIIVAICIGAAGGIFVYAHVPNRSDCSSYAYVSQGSACSGSPVINKAGYVVLQDQISQFIQSQDAAGTTTNVAVFFRDLNDGPTFGINEDQDFIPASLLKLPVVMSIFQMEEAHPGFIKTTLEYSTTSLDVSVPEGIETPDVPGMTFGTRYSLEQLMASTIINSDNLAYYLLIGYMDQTVPNGGHDIDSTLAQLGIVDPTNVDQQSVTVTQYASLFRLLYTSSFLNPHDSEELLSWLSQSTFNDGLQAGVPSSVVVADKWGLRSLPDGTQELHDCGIIYYPRNPYVLCVMTEGNNQTALANVIATISQMVYAEVDSRKLPAGSN